MATTSKNINLLINQELSIQIRLNGLSFCILETQTNTISYLKHNLFNTNLNPIQLLEQLKESFATEPKLQESFSKVQVIYANSLSTLVPQALFNENALADYLKFNAKILPNDFITYDTITNAECMNVYIPLVNCNNYIFERYGSFSYKHHATILITKLLQSEKNKKEKKIVINVSATTFEIVYLKNGSLQLYNSFSYTTKEDFIYYILFTLEQLDVNPETIPVYFLGTINHEDETYKITYKYIRNVFFESRKENYTFSKPPKTNYSDFVLISSFSCE